MSWDRRGGECPGTGEGVSGSWWSYSSNSIERQTEERRAQESRERMERQ